MDLFMLILYPSKLYVQSRIATGATDVTFLKALPHITEHFKEGFGLFRQLVSIKIMFTIAVQSVTLVALLHQQRYKSLLLL